MYARRNSMMVLMMVRDEAQEGGDIGAKAF